MKHLKITYQGKVYEVDVEETISGVAASPPAAPVAAPKAAAAAPVSSGEINGVEAPLSGRIAKILVTVGQSVIEGEELIILEAMKLEHTIYSDWDGVVTEICVKQNDIVNTADILVIIG